MTDFEKILADAQAKQLAQANMQFDLALRKLLSARETPQPTLADTMRAVTRSIQKFIDAWRGYGS
jgi:hypothetical protein